MLKHNCCHFNIYKHDKYNILEFESRASKQLKFHTQLDSPPPPTPTPCRKFLDMHMYVICSATKTTYDVKGIWTYQV